MKIKTKYKIHKEIKEAIPKCCVPGPAILLTTSSACENWCYYIWSKYNKSFSKCHEKVVSAVIEGTTT